MFTTKTFACGVALAAITATATFAETYDRYGAVDSWTVFANTETKGCFIESENNNGNVVQMGIRDAGDTVGFIGVFNKGESVLSKGEKREMLVELDGDPFTIIAHSSEDRVSDGYTGGYMFANNPDFIRDISEKNVMKVHTSDSTSFEIDLTGTKKALEMARECYASQNG